MQKDNKIEINFCMSLDRELNNEELKELEQNYKELIAYTFNKDIKKFKIKKLHE